MQECHTTPSSPRAPTRHCTIAKRSWNLHAANRRTEPHPYQRFLVCLVVVENLSAICLHTESVLVPETIYNNNNNNSHSNHYYLELALVVPVVVVAASLWSNKAQQRSTTAPLPLEIEQTRSSSEQ